MKAVKNYLLNSLYNNFQQKAQAIVRSRQNFKDEKVCDFKSAFLMIYR